MPLRQVLYLAMAVLGLLLTWTCNLQFMLVQGGFGLQDFIASGFANPAAASLGCDLLVACLAFLVWLPVEARRQGMRHWWLYLVLTCTVAFAFAFPLFLFMRERRLAVVSAR